jgi:hypothetical protein
MPAPTPRWFSVVADRGLKVDVESLTALLARWPLIEPGGFATDEAAAAIFREARRHIGLILKDRFYIRSHHEVIT